MSNRDLLCDIDEEMVIFEYPEYDEAIIGYTDDHRVVYDYDLMVKCLIESENMTYEEAVDWVDYNAIRALGYIRKAPIVMHRLTD